MRKAQTRPSSDTCEINRSGRWFLISIEEDFEPELQMRCPLCQGAVKPFAKSKAGMKAHFRHVLAHKGCPRSITYKGRKRAHPAPLN